MGLTRRQLLAVGATGAWRAAAQFKPGGAAKPRAKPPVCLYSKHLVKVEYDELGKVLRDLGFDGCDLSVEPGGHVLPEQAQADLVRAVEAVTGVGLDVPMITTSMTSPADPNVNLVLGLAAFMGVPLFRPGVWKYNGASEIEARLAEVQRDIAGLASVGRGSGMAMGLRNVAGDNVGGAVWDTHLIIRGMDPRWVGYDFDPGSAAAQAGVDGWWVALRLALPRLKMVTLNDFIWAKGVSGAWKATPCPLGEGMVDWAKFFAALARVKFTGPISIEMGYRPKNELDAIRRDLEFVRKQVAAAYPG
ncbi:MAG: sugar phosphate isomerase/epimerase family protein [Bryobacteraceae bacterium]|jgi:sugar phosphate isomerase/epimerase